MTVETTVEITVDESLLRTLTPIVIGILVRRGADFAAAEDGSFWRSASRGIGGKLARTHRSPWSSMIEPSSSFAAEMGFPPTKSVMTAPLTTYVPTTSVP